MNSPRSEHGSQISLGRRHDVPLADAWLPGLGDVGRPPPRKSWNDFNPAERRRWLIKVGLLMALSLTLVLRPSSLVRDIVVWSAFLFVLSRKAMSLFSKKPDKLSLAILAYTLVVAASVAYSAHREWSVKDASKFLVVLAMVFAAWHLFKNRVFFFGFLQLLISCVFVVCIYDVVTYLSGLGRHWQWGERWVFGPYYGHPNTASAIIMLLLPISVFLLVTARNAWLRAMHGCFLGLGVFLMYVMASRTAQISLALMIVFGAILIRPRKRRIIALGAICCLLLPACLGVRLLNPRLRDETMKTLTFRDENWRNLSKLIAKRPILGYGYGKRNYQTIYHRSFRSAIPYEHAHSLLFQTAFETGIVGLAAIMWLWAATIRRLLRSYSGSRGHAAALFGSVLVSFLGISIYCLAEVPDGFLRSLLWLLIAITGALTGKEEQSERAGEVAEPEGGT